MSAFMLLLHCVWWWVLCVRSLRTQQRALSQCQITSASLLWGLRFLWLFGLSVDSLFSWFQTRCGTLFRCCMHFFFTESLILAQDERWRRA